VSEQAAAMMGISPSLFTVGEINRMTEHWEDTLVKIERGQMVMMPLGWTASTMPADPNEASNAPYGLGSYQ